MSNRAWQIILLVLTLGGAYFFINVTLDDPFISYRYAENLASENGLVFNPGERVEGFSNPTWTLLMSACALVIPKFHPLMLMWISKLFGVIITFFTIFLVFRTERNIYPEKFPIGSVALALNPGIWLWSVGGMETMLAAMLLAVVLHDEIVNKGTITGSIAMGLLAITRPEMSALAIAYFIWRWASTGKPFWSRLPETLWLLAPVLIYQFFRLHYYQDFFPNTYYAKTPYGDLWYGIRYVIGAGREFLHFWVLVPFFIVGLIKSREHSELPLFLILVYFLVIILVGGDWMPGARFMVHIAPLLTWFVITGFHQVGETVRMSERNIFIFILLPLMIIANYIIISKGMELKDPDHCPWPWNELSIESPVYRNYYEVANWLLENTNEDDSVATGEIGLIPFVSGRPTIDCFGLVDRYIARLPGETHRKFDAAYVLSKKPDYILIMGYLHGDQLDSRFYYCNKIWETDEFHDLYEQVYTSGEMILYRRIN